MVSRSKIISNRSTGQSRNDYFFLLENNIFFKKMANSITSNTINGISITTISIVSFLAKSRASKCKTTNCSYQLPNVLHYFNILILYYQLLNMDFIDKKKRLFLQPLFDGSGGRICSLWSQIVLQLEIEII